MAQKRTTNDSGIPVASDEHSLTAGPNGPTLLQDAYLVQKMQHFNRERVPERVVHAKGSGAHGFFEVTEDVTQWTKAAFLSDVGKRTPMFARFSQVAGELGSADTVRDPRGFALKFYTEEGNYDLVGNNTPTFFVRDAIKFEDFSRSQRPMPWCPRTRTSSVAICGTRAPRATRPSGVWRCRSCRSRRPPTTASTP